MECVRRLAGAHRPAPSAGTARPEPRPGRPRTRLVFLLSALALLLGVLSLFDAAPVQAQAPGVPTGLRTSAGPSGTLDVFWTAPSSGTVTDYGVHYTRSATVGLQDNSGPSDPDHGWHYYSHSIDQASRSPRATLGTSIRIVGLRPGTAHRIRVRAKNTNSATSSWVEISGTTLGTAQPPRQPPPPPLPVLQNRPQLSGLSLSAGGNAVTLTPTFAGGTPSYTATVPPGTTTLSITPTWTGGAIGKVGSKAYGGDELTAKTSVTSGNSVDVTLASGARYSGNEHRTLVSIELLGANYSQGYAISVRQRVDSISASLSVSPNR